MCCCIDYCQISRYPPPCFLYEKKQLEDATNLTRNSSQHQIKDYGVGLLASLVDFYNFLVNSKFCELFIKCF